MHVGLRPDEEVWLHRLTAHVGMPMPRVEVTTSVPDIAWNSGTILLGRKFHQSDDRLRKQKLLHESLGHGKLGFTHGPESRAIGYFSNPARDRWSRAMLVKMEAEMVNLSSGKESDMTRRNPAIISKERAREIASWWHGGQGSGLYSFSSSGHVSWRALNEARKEERGNLTSYKGELRALIRFLEAAGADDLESNPMPNVAGPNTAALWYNNPRGRRHHHNPMSHEARELLLFIENDGQLYRQQHEPIIANLNRKVKSGKYNHELAVKLFRYLADSGAKNYVQAGGSAKGIFTVAVRNEVARALRDDYEAEYMHTARNPLAQEPLVHMNMLNPTKECVLAQTHDHYYVLRVDGRESGGTNRKHLERYAKLVKGCTHVRFVDERTPELRVQHGFRNPPGTVAGTHSPTGYAPRPQALAQGYTYGYGYPAGDPRGTFGITSPNPRRRRRNPSNPGHRMAMVGIGALVGAVTGSVLHTDQADAQGRMTLFALLGGALGFVASKD